MKIDCISNHKIHCTGSLAPLHWSSGLLVVHCGAEWSTALKQQWYCYGQAKVAWPKLLHNNTEGQSGANLTSTTMSSQLHELENSGIVDRDAITNPPPTGGGLEAGHKNPPAQVTLNWRMMSCHLIKAKKKQCLTTLPKEDQAMIHIETEREHILSRDKMKVMIAHNHIQRVAVWQQGLMTKISWTGSCPRWLR